MKRLQYNSRAVRMYHTCLKNSIKKEDDFEVYLNIGNLLHWIIITEEWHKQHNTGGNGYEQNKKLNNTVGIMKAIRFANNSMKHNMIFRRLHLMPTGTPCGSNEAICGTFFSGTDEVIWNPVPGFRTNKPWQMEQYECYNKYLKLKGLIKTLDPVVNFLHMETTNYLSKMGLGPA